MKPPSVAWDGSSTRSPSPRGVDPVAVAGDKRIHIRFDMLFPCVMASELYGEAQVVVRNVSAGGMMVQTADILPFGAVVTVHFRMSDCDDEIVARAEVKHHLCLNFGAPGAELLRLVAGQILEELDRGFLVRRVLENPAHLCLNFGAPGAEPRAARAMGLRFLDFDTELPLTLASQRVLH